MLWPRGVHCSTTHSATPYDTVQDCTTLYKTVQQSTLRPVEVLRPLPLSFGVLKNLPTSCRAYLPLLENYKLPGYSSIVKSIPGAWKYSINFRLVVLVPPVFSLSRSQSRVTSRKNPLNVEDSEYRLARGLLWRTWLKEWVAAAQYLSVRQLLHPMLRVGTFEDNSGGTHNRLYEHLELGSEGEADAEGSAEAKVRYFCVALRLFQISFLFFFKAFHGVAPNHSAVFLYAESYGVVRCGTDIIFENRAVRSLLRCGAVQSKPVETAPDRTRIVPYTVK